MGIVSVRIVDSTNVAEVRQIFKSELLQSELYFEGVRLVIFPEDFEHICYEYGEGAQYKTKFSARRSRRMLLIKSLCLGEIPYTLIFQKERENKSIIVLSECLEYAMYIVPQPSKKGLFFRLGTIIAFGKNVESKIEKEKQKGELVANVREVLDQIEAG